MSNTVSFINQGEIDSRAIATLGVSVKQEGSFGFFGTGLKYAIAILLRMGQKVTIYAGTEQLDFTSRTETIRGEDFDIVYMNGESLGVTTGLGKNWLLWQAYREIICNCLDEDGNYQEGLPEPKAGQTIVSITGRDFMLQHHKRADIILEGSPFESLPGLEIHRGSTKNVYYRGVKVHEARKPYAFTYNMLDYTELTEDRTLSSEWLALNCGLLRNLVASTHQDVIKACIYDDEEHMEGVSDFQAATPSYQGTACRASEQFKAEAVAAVKMCNRSTNTSVADFAGHKASELLQDQETASLNPSEVKILLKAVAFCKSLEFSVDDYEIRVMDRLDRRLLGLASCEIIYITKTAFEMGTKMVAGTLIEEFIHLRYSVSDCTREFQDLVINKMISIGEMMQGEPL